jgi:hypothetical protein
MGNMQQEAWAEVVAEGSATLEMVLSASFAGNFYPPLDQGLVAPTAEAIRAAATCLYEPEELHDLSIVLPDGLSMRPRAAEYDEDTEHWFVRVTDLLDATRAWPFVQPIADGVEES